MKNKYVIAVVLLIGIVQGCAHRYPRAGKEGVRDPNVVLTPNLVDRIRSQEEVVQYRVGPYIDPVDPGLLHEGHVVYELRKDSEWITENRSWGVTHVFNPGSRE